ncbi:MULTISPECIES: polysaccharide biosynthesis tyrosine autokinase [unclassified Yoonia]|uniref:polysaccharide biosynthesis tyrosine autokinase n=1 Tax=unclassified Yoonia TaxID=2629118 RepID=UPI002B000581|nr:MULTISPECIES: AAA family ATPase [unclassified Yoonia]
MPSPPITAVAELDTAPPVDLAQMIRVVWAGKWLIIVLTMLALVLAGYYSFTIASPRYAAISVIDIAPDIASPGTEIEVLRATDTLQQVIDRLHLRDDPAFNRYLTPVPLLSITGTRTALRNLLQGRSDPPPDAAMIASKLVQNLRAALHIENPRDSTLLRITVTTGDPQQAISIANTLAAVYLADGLARQQARMDAEVAWLTTQSGDLHARIATIETAIQNLITQEGLQDPTRQDNLARDLREVEALLATAQASLARSTDRANRARLTRQITALDGRRTTLATLLQALGAAQTTLDSLQNDLATNRNAQTNQQAQLLALQSGQTSPQARVLNKATAAQYIGPQKILLLQIAGLVGVLAGLMLVILRHSLRRGFTDAQDLQDATGLPVLAQLPLLPSRRPAHLLTTLDTSGPSAATESYRHLRTALMLQGSAAPQVILSTSAIPGEGKTTQAIGLAHSFAGLGKRVLLIDADLRQGAFVRYFHLAGNDGLAAVILGHIGLAAATEPSAIPGVDLLAGGAQDEGGAELLFNPALADVVRQARAHYDLIVIDAPPVMPVPDTLTLARHADAVLFALRWDHTPAPVLRAALQRLTAAQVPVTGLVLTQVHSRKQAQRGGISFVRYGRGYFHA